MTSSVPGRRRFTEYQDLMRHRIMDILLVSTAYDTFILEESGELSERMLGEFRNLDLHYSPGLTGISTGTEALRIAREQKGVNLIITTPHLADMDAAALARQIQAEGLDVPVVLLAWDTRELADFQARKDTSAIERTFLWQGDARMLVSIVKSVEDWRNAEHDALSVGVQVIILVEDNVRYYSSFLPVMYTELLHHSARAAEQLLEHPRAGRAGDPGDQARLRLDLLAARQGVPPGPVIPRAHPGRRPRNPPDCGPLVARPERSSSG
jgi:CheY-like chemotaxis protein